MTVQLIWHSMFFVLALIFIAKIVLLLDEVLPKCYLENPYKSYTYYY